jgi:hypothetical protein
VASESLAQAVKSIRVRRGSSNLDGHAVAVEQVEVETLATEIQTGVQHRVGPPFVS